MSALERIAELRARGGGARSARRTDTAALEELRIAYLGRKAELPQLLRGVAELPPAERAAVGARRQRRAPGARGADRARARPSSRAAELDARLRRRPRRRHAAGRAARSRPATCT